MERVTYNHRQFIAFSRDGKTVSYDPEKSHAATHLEDTPNLIGLVKEIIPTIELSDYEDTVLEIDMGRVIGQSSLVEIRPSDEVFFALRKNRDRLITFVKNREPEDVSLVTIIVKPTINGMHDLHSSWIGPLAPPVPGDENETPESRAFWNTHALIDGTQEIIPGTETSECPW